MNKLRIAVLGCGPAGLMAAHAVKRQTGQMPLIYSRKVKSVMFGAMYLHKPIPGITPGINSPEFMVDVIKNGTRDGYAKLVYGDPNAPCSWDVIKPGRNPAWHLGAAYNKLWDLYADDIIHCNLHPIAVADILKENDIVFSTVPAKAICNDPRHEFKGQKIWVDHRRADPNQITYESIMVYNGYPPDGSVTGMIGYEWYRFSQICGYQAWEYTSVPAWARGSFSEGLKPIITDCDCWPNLIRLGRFGKWEKGVLTHHAFEEAETTMVRAVEYDEVH